MENKFKEIDKTRVIEFLNFIAKKAAFNNMSVQDNIEFFKLLSYMQQEIIPKIDSNIFEIIAVHESEDTEGDTE